MFLVLTTVNLLLLTPAHASVQPRRDRVNCLRETHCLPRARAVPLAAREVMLAGGAETLVSPGGNATLLPQYGLKHDCVGRRGR